MKRSVYALIFSTEKRFLHKNDDFSQPGVGLMLIVFLIYANILMILKLFGVYNYIRQHQLLHFFVSSILLYAFMLIAFRVFKRNYISPESLSEKEKKSGKRFSYVLFVGGALLLAIMGIVYEKFIK